MRMIGRGLERPGLTDECKSNEVQCWRCPKISSHIVSISGNTNGDHPTASDAGEKMH